MSIEDPLGAKIRAKIQWHHAEIKRLQAIFEEFEGGAAPLTPPPPPTPRTRAPQPPRTVAAASDSAVKASDFVVSVREVLKDGEALSSREIADRLKAAGYESEAQNFYATVYNQLANWASKGVGVLKVGDRATGVLWRRK